jgi:hypothetical protein
VDTKRLREIWDAIGAIEASADSPREHRLWAGDGDEIGRAFGHIGAGLTPEDVAFAFASGRRLLDAADALAALVATWDEHPVARFDRLADLYRRETGQWAPGKDVPDACNDALPYPERRDRWERWLTAYIERTETGPARRALAALAKEGA